MLVSVTKTIINGGPRAGLISWATSNPRYELPKNTLTKIQLIWLRLKLSRARSVNVVRNPKYNIATIERNYQGFVRLASARALLIESRG